MTDYAEKSRQDFIAGKHKSRDEKLKDAIAQMGERYVFHPSNRVKKMPGLLANRVLK